MGIRAAVIPDRYMIGSGIHPETGRRAYYVLRQDEDAPDCWRRIAGPYVQRGGAIQRLDRILARGEPPAPTQLTPPPAPSAQQRAPSSER